MDIDGLGEKQACASSQEGLIDDVADIYDLDEERLVELEGFGEVSARNLIAAIEASRARPFKRVLFALGLPGVGYVTAEALAEHFGSIDALHARRPGGDRGGRGGRPDHGRADRRVARRRAHLELIEQAAARRACGSSSTPPSGAPTGGPLEGKTLVLTGTLPELTREEAAALIKAPAARSTGSVSKKTDYVVAGDSPGSKLAKAEELGTEILDEAGLRELLAVGGTQ